MRTTHPSGVVPRPQNPAASNASFIDRPNTRYLEVNASVQPNSFISTSHGLQQNLIQSSPTEEDGDGGSAAVTNDTNFGSFPAQR